jgi:hypothetical protein
LGKPRAARKRLYLSEENAFVETKSAEIFRANAKIFAVSPDVLISLQVCAAAIVQPANRNSRGKEK